MRHGKCWAVLAVLIATGCSSSEPLKDMVGYVPPTSLPAQPKRTLVADAPEQVWDRLVGFLEASAFAIDHIDEEKGLLIARYSGDPNPYIDCGSIVTHQNGTLDQIAGSASAVALNYDVDNQPVILNRTLNLDSRIIIRLIGRSQGTVIETDTTYVVTKTIDVADHLGNIREGSRETVSFEAGSRGEFSKGTACQPNGSLDLAVLQSLPNIVGTDDIDRAELQSDDGETAERAGAGDDAIVARTNLEEQETVADLGNAADRPADAAGEAIDGLDAAAVPSLPDDGDFDWVLPEQGLPTAALPAPKAAAPDASSASSAAAEAASPLGTGSKSTERPAITAVDDPPPFEPEPAAPVQTAAATASPPSSEDEVARGDDSPTTIVDDTTRKLLASLDCGGEEWHFCDLVEITTPYRKRNIERLFGLTVNTTESFTSQVVGSDLKLDILFPSFPSHLHIAYARRDGMIEHVMSSPERWPADLSHQLVQADQRIPGPAGLAMIIAVASDEPLFSSAPESAEDAKVYLDRLQQRLAELESADPDGSVAASQLLIFVENAKT